MRILDFKQARVWATSDTHFNHANICAYSGRPFASIGQMNEALIAYWNSVVEPNDIVIHMGDFAMGDRSLIPDILFRLNGHITMIAGNHDNKRDDRYYMEVIREPAVLKYQDLTIELRHNPAKVRGLGDIAFCGHVHEKWAYKAKGEIAPEYLTREHSDPAFEVLVPTYNVGVDVRNYLPQLIEQILAAHT